MSFTLGDLIKECELAIPIYREIAEDDGMAGDNEAYESWNNDADKLEKLIEAMRKQLNMNQIVSLASVSYWLNSEENKTVKQILMSALSIVRDRKMYEVKKLQKEVDFCDKFLKCEEFRL